MKQEQINYMKLKTFNAVRAELFGYELDPIDHTILVVSKLHVHTELQFSHLFEEVSFSATMRDEKCARFMTIKYSHPAYWDTVLIPVTEDQEKVAYCKAKEIEGRQYDLVGLTSLVTKYDIVKPDPKKVWCTKAGFIVLDEIYPAMLFTAHLTVDQLHPTLGDSIARWYFSKTEFMLPDGKKRK